MPSKIRSQGQTVALIPLAGSLQVVSRFLRLLLSRLKLTLLMGMAYSVRKLAVCVCGRSMVDMFFLDENRSPLLNLKTQFRLPNENRSPLLIFSLSQAVKPSSVAFEERYLVRVFEGQWSSRTAPSKDAVGGQPVDACEPARGLTFISQALKLLFDLPAVRRCTFSLESFLMGGGWLVFDASQALYVPPQFCDAVMQARSAAQRR